MQIRPSTFLSLVKEVYKPASTRSTTSESANAELLHPSRLDDHSTVFNPCKGTYIMMVLLVYPFDSVTITEREPPSGS
jgi:hypothetical protein